MSAIENRTIKTKEEFWSLVSENKDGLKVFDFEDCEFNCDINIADKEVYYIRFLGCRFLKNFRLKTKVTRKANFLFATFQEKSDFSSSTFEVAVNFAFTTFQKEADFRSSTFKNIASFTSSTFEKIADFRSSTFKGGAYFNSSTFQGGTDFAFSTFEKIADFISSTFEWGADFTSSTFREETHFINSTFKGGAHFVNSRFDKQAFFQNSSFYKIFDLSGSIFNKVLDFKRVYFLDKALFRETEFKENVLFTDAIIKDDIVFRGTKFKKGLDLSLAVITGQINSFDIQLENYDTISNDKKEVGEYEIRDKNKRETFRILKHHNIKQSNSIDYIELARLEHEAYASELWDRITQNSFFLLLVLIGIPILIPVFSLVFMLIVFTYPIKAFFANSETVAQLYLSFKDFLKILSDYLIFSLNRYSNNHGTSYWRGIAFTFLVGWVFFYSSLLTIKGFDYTSFEPKVFEGYVRYYFDFMNPTHKIDYLKPQEAGAWSYLWDFLGRVFISYGIYQTVQAFRKYKKG